MLWEMRGCDGNFSGWNGSHGSGDSTRGSCATKTLKAGAYVVNSNSWAGSFNGYCQVGNSNQDFALQSSSNRYKSKRPSIPVVWQRQPTYPKESSSYYPVNHINISDTQSVLRDKHPSDLVNSANFRIRQNSDGFPAQPSKTEGFRNSVPVQEFGSDLSVDGSNLSNVYQGTVVRVNVPDLYSEVGENIGNVKENGSVVAYRQKTPNIDRYKKETRNVVGQEIYGDPVPVETYRRINDWLKNCQHFSNDPPHSSHSTKSVYSSPKVDHPYIEKINHQKAVSASKPEYGASIQSGAAPTFRISKEPRIVAGLESKTNKTKGGSANSVSNQQRRSSCMVSTEHSNLVYLCESSTSKAPEAEGSRISNVSYVAQQCRTAFECDLNPSPSEWSSETLSFTGSDKSSYCTDFTPFELGKGNVLQTQSQKSTSEFEQKYSTNKSESTFVSQIPTDGKAHTGNDVQRKEFAQIITRRQLQSSNVNDKSNGRFEGHRRLDNFEPKFRQREYLTKNSEDEKGNRKANLPARMSLAPAVNVAADHGQNSHFEFSDYDDAVRFVTEIENRPKYRQHQTAIHSENARKCEQNVKILEGGVVHGDKRSEVFVSVAKLRREEGNRPYGSKVERPRSLNTYTDRNQPLSLVRDDISKRQVNDVGRTSNSRPVTQIKNGSLSITIRPKYPTAFDVFDNPEISKDLLHVKDQFSQKGNGTRSSEAVVLRGVIHKPSETLETLENTKTVPFDRRSASKYSSASSQDSEEQDDFTGTFIHADVPTKVAPPAVKSECSMKVEYRRNRSAKASMSSFLVNAPDRFEKTVSEKPRAHIASEFDRLADCRDIERHEFRHSPQVDEYQKPESRPSTVSSSGSSSKIQNDKKILAFKRIFKKARSYIGERLGDGNSEYDHEFKINRVGGFEGEESKAVPQTTQRKLSASSPASRSKSHSQHAESFEPNQISIPNPIANNQAASNVYSYCEDQDKVNNLLQTSDYESSRFQTDPLKSGNDALALVTKFSNEASSSVDTSPVGEQTDHRRDLSRVNEIAKPQLQALDSSSQLTLKPTFVEDLSDQAALRRRIDYSEEYPNACSASKQSQNLGVSGSSDNELTKMLDICTLNDSKVISAEDSQILDPATFSQDFPQGYGGLEDNECCDDAFAPDSVSLVSEVLKAFDDIQRKGRELLDSKDEDLCSEAEQRKGDDDAFAEEEKSKDVNEEMSCQEYVEFREDLVIEPPMSFSDFTITL